MESTTPIFFSYVERLIAFSNFTLVERFLGEINQHFETKICVFCYKCCFELTNLKKLL